MALWRSAVGLAYADHKLTDEERDILHEFFSHQELSEEQLKILDDDIENNVNLDETFEQITDPRDRAHLINIARVLFYADGHFCEKEQELLAELHRRHLDSLDTDFIFSEARDKAIEEKELIEMKDKTELENMKPVPRLLRYLTDWIRY